MLGHDLAAATGGTFLVLIRPVLQAAFDVEGIALLDVFGRGLRQTIPTDDAVDLRFLLAFDLAVGGQADGGDWFALSLLQISEPTRP